MDKNKKHTIEIVVDRIIIRPNITTRLTDSIETALRYGSGVVVVDVIGRKNCCSVRISPVPTAASPWKS